MTGAIRPKDAIRRDECFVDARFEKEMKTRRALRMWSGVGRRKMLDEFRGALILVAICAAALTVVLAIAGISVRVWPENQTTEARP